MLKPDKIWFQDRIRDRKLSQRRLAKLMDLDPAAMSLMLAGKRKMSTEEANALAMHLGVSVPEIMQHAGIRPHRAGNITASYEIRGAGDVKPLKKQERLEAPEGFKAAKALVSHHDKSPYYKWTLYYMQRTGVDADCIGYLCLVESGEDFMLGRIYPGGRRGLYDVSLINGETKPDLAVSNASPILSIKT